MTAFIVAHDVQARAEAIAGAVFGIELALEAQPTHVGCNWAGCPEEIEQALGALEGVSVGADFWELCVQLGLAPVVPEEP